MYTKAGNIDESCLLGLFQTAFFTKQRKYISAYLHAAAENPYFYDKMSLYLQTVDITVLNFHNDKIITDECLFRLLALYKERELPLKTLILIKTAISDDAIEQVTSKCGSTLLEVNVNFCENLTNNAIIHIGKNCHKLTTLEMSGIKLEPSGFKALANSRSTASLEVINFNKIVGITRSSIASVARKCHSLHSLFVVNNNFTPGDIQYLKEIKRGLVVVK